VLGIAGLPVVRGEQSSQLPPPISGNKVLGAAEGPFNQEMLSAVSGPLSHLLCSVRCIKLSP